MTKPEDLTDDRLAAAIDVLERQIAGLDHTMEQAGGDLARPDLVDRILEMRGRLMPLIREQAKRKTQPKVDTPSLAHMTDDELADEVEHARECFARAREAMQALREEQAGYMARIRAGAAEQARRENRALEIGGHDA